MLTFDKSYVVTAAFVAIGFVAIGLLRDWKSAAIFLMGAMVGSIRLTFG